MPKYKVECSSGFCGVEETVIVNAMDESEAEEIAAEWWGEQLDGSTGPAKEIDNNDDGYEEIN